MEISITFFTGCNLGVTWDSDLVFQATSKVTEHQYLHTSCLQAYPVLELNTLLKKLIFNVQGIFCNPGTLGLSLR